MKNGESEMSGENSLSRNIQVNYDIISTIGDYDFITIFVFGEGMRLTLSIICGMKLAQCPLSASEDKLRAVNL